MSSDRNCRHPDIRNFDGVRCCLACGHALFDEPANTHSDPHSTNTKEYTYKRLNHDLGKQIRLLVLHRGSGSDPLTCDIIHANLADNPIYEALSYTWATDAGDSSQCRDIMCGNSKISITKNCEAALLTLRNRDRKRTLWVDSICIDQTSIGERNHQVALMDVIYSHAAQVLVYLGPGSLDSDVILDCLEGDAAASEMLAEDYRYLHNFLSTRWFDRVWVLQEVALAKLVLLYAGDKVIHWTAQSIQKMLDLCEEGRRKPPSIFNWTPASRKDEDILHCLHRSRECSSTDPRDKVFALLSLVSPEHQKWISADYSMPTEEVFFQVAEYLIMQHSRLDVLMYAQGPLRVGEIKTIPSWVPRWDVKLAEHPLVPQFSDQEMEILSSCWFEEDGVPLMPQAHYQHQFSGPSSHLSIASNIFDIGQSFRLNSRVSPAQTLAPQMTDELPFAIAKCNSADNHAPPDLAKMLDAKMELNESFNSSCLRIRAHRLDKITESGWDAKIDDEELNNRSVHHQRWRTTTAAPLVYRSHRTCKTCAQSATHPTSPSPSLTRLQAHLRNQFYDAFDAFGQSARKIIGPTRPISVFQTENSVGIAWQGFEEGDTVWALHGLPVPFILRKQGNHYVLVGQCYLLGALNAFHPCMYCGEAARAWPICTEVVDIW